ncbi:MAG: TatD family hydrolase [Parachlamydiales bacterium]|nr:TatD family hydrolase [Parachlamydiales bacterium]
MHYFDSHAHLSGPEILPHIDGVMQRAKLAGVTRVLNICTDPQTLKDGLVLEKKFNGLRNAGATTPHDVEKEGEECFSIFREAAISGKLVAVGETGLEYFYKELDRKIQQRFLIRYLHLAQECSLPVIFHCREAFADLFSITDGEYAKNASAVLHCFTGSIQEAEEVLSRGWFLSLSGIVTFKKSEMLREVAKIAPLNQLLIETDAPYLSPQSKRGKPNEPAYLPETAKVIAEVKGISLEELAKATFSNAANLFNI